MSVFSVVAPCSLSEIYQCFKDPCCLHHQGYQPSTLIALTTEAARTSETLHRPDDGGCEDLSNSGKFIPE